MFPTAEDPFFPLDMMITRKSFSSPSGEQKSHSRPHDSSPRPTRGSVKRKNRRSGSDTPESDTSEDELQLKEREDSSEDELQPKKKKIT